GWFVSAVTVYLNATDATSGVANITYRIDGGPWRAYAGPFVLAEGRHAVDFQATDLAGNVESRVTRTILVDTTRPSTNASLSGIPGHSPWYVSGVTVYLNASDTTSGVAGLVYRVDGGNWTAYSGPFTLADGVHLIEYHATDVAGLVELTKSRTVSIDTVPPTTGANGWFTSDVVVSLTSSDPESGIGSVFVQVDGGGWVVYTGPVTLMDGRHLVDYYAVNNAGLSEASHTVAILVDTVPPTTVISLSGTLGANGWYTSNVTVSLTATDATSGVANVSYRIDGGPW